MTNEERDAALVALERFCEETNKTFAVHGSRLTNIAVWQVDIRNAVRLSRSLIIAICCGLAYFLVTNGLRVERESHALSKRITTLERRVTAAERAQDAPKPVSLPLEPRGDMPALEWLVKERP